MRRHPRQPGRVLLNREVIQNDEELGHAINAVLTVTPDIQKHTKEVRLRERAFRKVLNDEQWRIYVLLEEAVNDRVVIETDVLVRWAFEEGFRDGRGR